jgi:uncharacterized protein YoxC
MEFFLNSILPMLLYIVAIVLIVVLIVVGIKLIKILNKVDAIADNINEKVNTFDGALRVLKNASDGIASITDTVVFTVTSAISKVFGAIKKNNENDKEEIEDE